MLGYCPHAPASAIGVPLDQFDGIPTPERGNEKIPSRMSKLDLLRSNRLLAQSNVICWRMAGVSRSGLVIFPVIYQVYCKNDRVQD
jgi:hypothetical protein